jgi:hypothetical protein
MDDKSIAVNELIAVFTYDVRLLRNGISTSELAVNLKKLTRPNSFAYLFELQGWIGLAFPHYCDLSLE